MNKKTTQYLASISIIGSLLLFAACSSSAEKVEKAETAVTTASENLEGAYANYAEDLENHRLQTQKAVEENKKLIESYKLSIAKDKKEILADKMKKINELEKKNTELQAKNDAYSADDTNNWENFKTELKRDLDELGNALKNLTQNNKDSTI
jgi:phosphoenolpyruvate-protein kinase (PTS system EI component)